MTESAWVAEDVPLRISLGEKTLFRPRLPLLVYQGIFTELPTAPAALRLPELGAGVGGYYISSRPVSAPLPSIAVVDGLLQVADSHFTRRLVSLEGTYEQFSKKWTSKTRLNLRRELASFRKLCGGAQIHRTFNDPADTAEYVRLLRVVNKKTYQASLFGYTIDDRHVAWVERLARDGDLVAHMLFHGDRPVAYAEARSHGRWLELERLGYDAEYRKYAPGKLVLMLAIESLFAAKTHDILDLGGGDAPYKEFFSTKGVPCAELYYLRFTPHNISVMGLRRAATRANQAAVTVLDRAGVKDRLKRFLRRQAAGARAE